MSKLVIDFLTSAFINGGWMIVVYASFRIVFWVVRKTTTTADDKILDVYVKRAVTFALSVMPKDSQVNWIKLTANALGKFNEAYTKEQGDMPDATTFEKAKKLIAEITAQEEFKKIVEQAKEIKNSNG